MDNHKLHLGIDGTLSFLKSTVNTENVVTGEKGYNTTRYPDGGNSMHTVEAFATHVWNISQKLSMHDGIRLGYATTYSSVKDTEQFPFFGGGSQRKNNLTYSAAIGLNYLPSKTWKTAFSMSTAYRVPNIDNTSKVFDSKVGTVTIPNKHIRPEKTVSADLNITKHVADVLTWDGLRHILLRRHNHGARHLHGRQPDGIPGRAVRRLYIHQRQDRRALGRIVKPYGQALEADRALRIV